MIMNREKAIIKVLKVFLMLLPLLQIPSNVAFVDATKGDNKDNHFELSATDLVIPTKEYVLKNGFPTNKNGQTYGPNIKNLMIEPDLMLVENEKGVVGYIYQPKIVSSPMEAIEYNKSFEKSTPIYLQDGETVIGVFSFR